MVAVEIIQTTYIPGVADNLRGDTVGKKIHILFFCDMYGSTCSCDVHLASTSEKKVREEVKRLVQKGDVIYTGKADYTDSMELREIGDALKNLYVVTVEDGQPVF